MNIVKLNQIIGGDKVRYSYKDENGNYFVSVKLEFLDNPPPFDGIIEEVCKRLYGFKNKFHEFINVRIESEHDYDWSSYELVGDRLETEQEKEIRIKKCKEHKEEKELAAKRELDKLERKAKKLGKKLVDA